MLRIDTLLRRPAAKIAVGVAAAAATAGGLYGAQAASAGAEEQLTVIRATTPQGEDRGGEVVARETPGNDARPAIASAIERADEPKGSTAGLASAPEPAATSGGDELR